MKYLLLLIIVLTQRTAFAQMVEYYAGHQRTGADLMWFNYFKNKEKERTPFLFFSRNRASVDYKQSPTLFGSTNAVSYQFKNGMGIVAVASFANAGFTPKAGVQYFKAKKSLLFFGWLVADLKKKGAVDLFGMLRYQPKINEQWNGFGQLELFPVYLPSSNRWNLTQRVRLGVKYHTWAGGWMMDLNQNGSSHFATLHNIGTFIRHEF